MYIGISLFLIAAGAILAWGTDFEIGGINVDAIGIILLVVGIIGIVASFVVGARRREDTTT